MRLLCATGIVAALAAPLAGQEAGVIAALVGEWSGSGTVTGRASSVTMIWSREPGASFLHLRFRNVMAASSARPAEVFEARGYYGVRPGAPAAGTWIDSRGVIFPVTFTATADTLTSDWGSEGTERGRTTYRVREAGILEVTDFVRSADGQYKEFGRVVLERKPRLPRDAEALKRLLTRDDADLQRRR